MKKPAHHPAKARRGSLCLAVLLGAFMSACGNPGALYLPEPPPADEAAGDGTTAPAKPEAEDKKTSRGANQPETQARRPSGATRGDAAADTMNPV